MKVNYGDRSRVFNSKGEIIRDFIFKTKMRDCNGETTGVERMITFLFQEDIVDKMIQASDENFPVLEYIVDKLVVFCNENNPEFSIVLENGVNKGNFVKCKKNTGIMVRKIMKYFGYEKVGLKRLTNTVEGVHSFVDSGVYKKAV